MTFLVIILALALTVVANTVFSRKLENRSYKVGFTVISVILFLLFAFFFAILGLARKAITPYVDEGVRQLEVQFEKTNPGMLDQQMDTEEIKSLLSSSLEKSDASGFEALAENMIKLTLRKYTAPALRGIKALEREENKLSVCDVILSLRDLALGVFTKIRIALAVIFVISIAAMIGICFLFHKESESKGVVFGEQADTEAGMKV